MATFVLIHGAWHGGWCWERLIPFLRIRGHKVFSPSLTGLGDQRHLLHPGITLRTHSDDIEGLIERAGLCDAVLVAHSYGGMVATVLADRRADRIKTVVYVSAFVPQEGQCLMDLSSEASRDRFRDQARAKGEGWLIPVTAASDPTFGVTSDEDLQWLSARLVSHPLATFEEPARLQGDLGSIEQIYVSLSLDSPTFKTFAEKARLEEWRTFELDTGHDAMITRPAELATVLHEASGS